MFLEFDAIVAEYEGPYEVQETDGSGYYDQSNGGQWVEGESSWVEYQGAILPMTTKELQYEANGTYTSEDRKLFTYQPHNVKQLLRVGGEDGTVYRINAERDYQPHTDIYIYVLKKKEPS